MNDQHNNENNDLLFPNLGPDRKDEEVSHLRNADKMIGLAEETKFQQTLLISITDPEHLFVFTKYSKRLINFIRLNKRIKKLKNKLIIAPKKNHQGEILLYDFGDEPNVTEFFEAVYEECFTELQPSFELYQKMKREFSTNVYNQIQNLRTPKFSIVDFREFSENCKFLTEIFIYVMINNQILQILFERHLNVFERNAFGQFLEKDKQKNKMYKTLLLHPNLVNLHYLMMFLMKKCDIKIENARKPSQQDLEEASRSGTQTGFADESAELIKLIQNQLNEQDRLIIHHQSWMLETIGISPIEYNNTEYFENKAKELESESTKLSEFLDLIVVNPVQETDPGKNLIYHSTHNVFDLWMILIHTFIFISNLYGVAMTSSLNATAYGLTPGISGAIQAATPLASTAAGFLFNYITLKKKYRYPLIIASFLMIVGNVLVFCSQHYNDINNPNNNQGNISAIIMLIIGRTAFGIGGARLLIRKYVILNVQPWAITSYSAILVGITAAGVCIGPGISSLLLFYKGGAKIGTISLTQYNIMAFVMIFVWIVYLIIAFIFFTGYNTMEAKEEQIKKENKTKIIQFFKDLKQEQLKDIFDQEAELDSKIKPKLECQVVPKNEQTLQKNDCQSVENGANPQTNQSKESKIKKEFRTGSVQNNQYSDNKQQLLISNENSTAKNKKSNISLRVVHPNKWAIFGAFCILFIKVI